MKREKKKATKVLSLILAFTFIFQISGGNVFALDGEGSNDSEVTSEDESKAIDSNGPVFSDISINKDILKIGERLEFTLKASDDISGIDRVESGISIGSEYRNLEFKYDESDLSYKYFLDITEDMIYSRIRLNWITIYDKAGNYTHVEMDILNKIQASVVGSDGISDNEPPVFNKLTFSKEQINVGDNLEIYVEASDALSGIYEVSTSILVGEQWEYYIMQYDDTIEKYKCTISITEDMYYKKIKVENLTIRDKAGNELNLWGEDLGSNSVYVTGENGEVDNVDPIFNGFTTNISVPKPGDILEVYIDAKDEGSGISTMYLDFMIKDRFYMTYFEYDAETEKYKSIIVITDDMKYGKIEFINLNIYDMAGNYLNVSSSQLSRYNLNIADENGMTDIVGPIVKSISFSSNKVKVGDTLDIFIDAEDSVSGVNEVRMSVMAGDNYISASPLYDEISEKYKYSMKITKDMEHKSVEIAYLNIRDNASNETNIGNDGLIYDKVLVVDSSGKADTLIPKFNGLEVSSSRVKVGEKVTISVDASDDKSGIEVVELHFRAGKDYMIMPISYNPDLNKYVYEFEVLPEMLFKKYEILMIIIKDNAGNMAQAQPTKNNIIYVEDIQGNVNDATFEVVSARVSSNVAKIGDRVKIEVGINAHQNQIQRVQYGYEVLGLEQYLDLKYNSSTGKYEGYIDIDETMKYSRIKPYGIVIFDKYDNNNSTGGKFLSKLFIDVPGEDGTVDMQAPNLKSIEFDKETAKIGEVVNIIAEASDEKSGVSQINVGLNNRNQVVLQYNEKTKKYEGSFIVSVDEFNYCPKIVIDYMSIYDNAGNSKWINYEAYEGLLIKIIDDGGYVDNIKPVLNKVNMSKSKYSLDESPALILDIDEKESGLDYVEVEIENFSGTKSFSYKTNQLRNDGRIVVKPAFYNFSFNDIYRVKQINIIDKAGNRTTYIPSDDKLNFQVGNYLENKMVQLNLDVISERQENVTGKASKGNIKIKLMRSMYGNGINPGIQVIDETVCDSNGNFKLNLDYMNPGSELLVEAYDLSTGEVLGYDIVNIYQSSDVNMDNLVDIEDLAQIAICYNEEPPRAGSGLESYLRYKSDINFDGAIDIYDLVLVSKEI